VRFTKAVPVLPRMTLSKRLELIRDRFMFLSKRKVNQKQPNENIFWVYTTQWPLSEHDKCYLQKKGFPIKSNCNLDVCKQPRYKFGRSDTGY
jgi:hypothetical protein